MLPELGNVMGQSYSAALFSTSLFVLITSLIAYEAVRYAQRIKGFKGPPGLPIVGNLWDIRGKNAPEQYRLWAKQYGEVYQIQLGNVTALVINGAQAAKEILVTNAQSTKTRPSFYTFHKIISDTSGTTLGTAPYSESLKRRRKAAATALNRPAVETYLGHLDRETRVFLREALDYGNAGATAVDPSPIFLRLNVSLGLTLHWGDRMPSQTDLFREIVYVEDVISNFRSTTGNLQDYIPLLRLNPFNSASAIAREMRSRRDDYMVNLDRTLDAKMEKGEAEPCIRVNVKTDPEAKLTDRELTSLNLTLLAAGLDTMNSAVGWGIGMLATQPDIQKKALAAIRQQYSEDQPLCDLRDQQTCQYVVLMVKEILRFFTMARLSLPRMANEDFIYDNKLIPRGTVIFLNAHGCNLDPLTWKDPHVFRPERWLEQPDAPIFTFGVGSRMCIGTQLAYRELYLLFMRLLSSFEIEPYGHIENDPVRGVANVSALTTQPKSYKVRFVPRNLKALQEALKDELCEGRV